MGHPVFTVSGARCNYWPGLARTRQEKSEIKNVAVIQEPVDYALQANGSSTVSLPLIACQHI